MVLHYETYGHGETVVLLHGMAGSGHYWRPLLEQRMSGKRFIVIDLLGFGHSPMPRDMVYDYPTHLKSIFDTLAVADVTKPYTIVAHSMGGLLALRLAAEQSSMVQRLILCGLPYYPDAATARRDITKSKKLWELAYYGPTSHALCTFWCRWLRPLSRHVAPLYLPHLPKEIAGDSVLHTWQAYSQSMDYIIERQHIADDIATVSMPIDFVYGARDTSAGYLFATDIVKNKPNVRLDAYPGLTHHLPVERPELIIELLQS